MNFRQRGDADSASRGMKSFRSLPLQFDRRSGCVPSSPETAYGEFVSSAVACDLRGIQSEFELELNISLQSPGICRPALSRTAISLRILHYQAFRLCFRSQPGILYRTLKVIGWRQPTFTRSSLAQGRGQGWHAAPVTQALLPRFGAAQGWDSPLRGTIPSEGLIVRGQSDFPPACWIFADC